VPNNNFIEIPPQKPSLSGSILIAVYLLLKDTFESSAVVVFEKYGCFIGEVKIIDVLSNGNKKCVEQKINVLSIVSISLISKP
jgi:hypothetical protein